MYQADGIKCDPIDRLLYEDRSQFWKEVTKAKRCNARRAPVISSKPTAFDYVEFYKNLFSHHDRPSNDEHRRIAANVSKYAESLKECVDFDGFTVESVTS